MDKDEFDLLMREDTEEEYANELINRNNGSKSKKKNFMQH
tara:strand:- start:378 stop:497 length:120 start_codon:yes stop_codon:yes gene_type:complete